MHKHQDSDTEHGRGILKFETYTQHTIYNNCMENSYQSKIDHIQIDTGTIMLSYYYSNNTIQYNKIHRET